MASLSTVKKVFAFEQPIRFSQCDPAGIVYYANFFDFYNAAVEDWFGIAMATPWRELYGERKLAFPVVATSTEFLHPCRLGDLLRVELTVAKLGRSSIELDIKGSVAGKPCLRARHKMAMISLETYRAVAIPDGMRGGILEYLTE
jgi:4-hydroxybenzoyl-CoA thioesterase